MVVISQDTLTRLGITRSGSITADERQSCTVLSRIANIKARFKAVDRFHVKFTTAEIRATKNLVLVPSVVCVQGVVVSRTNNRSS